MKIYRTGDKIEYPSACVALGDFDGMHKGHMRIFERASDAESFGALLFAENTKAAPEITPLDEKLRILEKIGADFAYIVHFDADFKAMSVEEFADYLKNIGAAGVCVGYDYRCARGASADSRVLSAALAARGMKITVCEPVTVRGEPIKSSKIRAMLAGGDIAGANELMCEPYRLCGEVVGGYRRGREMGFPTANIAIEKNKLLPPDGVYRAACKIDGKRHAVVLNIGKNPTFDAAQRSAEAHILGFSGDLYGERLAVEVAEKIRGELRFENADALRRQIEKDTRYVKEKENGA